MTLSLSGNLDDTLNSAEWTTLSVGTSAVEAKVGASAKVGRQVVRIYNDSNAVIYFGYSNSVTKTGSTKGEPLEKGQSINIPCTEAQSVWLIADAASNNVIVTEFA